MNHLSEGLRTQHFFSEVDKNGGRNTLFAETPQTQPLSHQEFLAFQAGLQHIKNIQVDGTPLIGVRQADAVIQRVPVTLTEIADDNLPLEQISALRRGLLLAPDELIPEERERISRYLDVQEEMANKRLAQQQKRTVSRRNVIRGGIATLAGAATIGTVYEAFFAPDSPQTTQRKLDEKLQFEETHTLDTVPSEYSLRKTRIFHPRYEERSEWVPADQKPLVIKPSTIGFFYDSVGHMSNTGIELFEHQALDGRTKPLLRIRMRPDSYGWDQQWILRSDIDTTRGIDGRVVAFENEKPEGDKSKIQYFSITGIPKTNVLYRVQEMQKVR